MIAALLLLILLVLVFGPGVLLVLLGLVVLGCIGYGWFSAAVALFDILSGRRAAREAEIAAVWAEYDAKKAK
jgi:multisubunit Na+/H+ antiporter MnhC subunit